MTNSLNVACNSIFFFGKSLLLPSALHQLLKDVNVKNLEYSQERLWFLLFYCCILFASIGMKHYTKIFSFYMLKYAEI